ncbi:MAG: hypothetical protein JXB48_11145 [Candidatus Latescibacteria bacterium]|nr:hypothetical protein [Candidatus Latescibacterota bacterium]
MQRMGVILILLAFIYYPSTIFSQEKLSPEEQKRKELNEKFDTYKIRYKTEFSVDNSIDFLKKPKDTEPKGDYTVAKVPPTVKLQIVPNLEPEYFPEGEAYMVCWANWAYMTRSEDNRFFFSVGDHRGSGCQINLYEYSPARDIVHKVLDVDELLGWTRYSYTDGKIHGHMGIMPDGTLWAATHYGVPPDSTWWANGYRGSWLLSYNINTHEAKNYGVPMIGSNLPCFTVDTERGRLVASGAYNMVMCWDCIEKKVRYAGHPPEGWNMWHRSMLLDEETGKMWSVDSYDKDNVIFMSFDPEYNKFVRYEASPPKNPYSGERSLTRGHTERPAMDGWFYWATWNGTLFKFKPEGPDGLPVTELVGTTWDEGRDVLQIGLSPKGRYIYFYPKGDAPIVQYDVKTGKRKALCWLQDYYFEKYGYWMDHVYGMDISKNGDFLVICQNGAFKGRDDAFGHPSLIVVEIPEEERQE